MTSRRSASSERVGRAGGRAGRAGRRAGWLGLLSCLVASLVIAALIPDPTTDDRRAYVGAPVGRWASTDNLSVEVVQARLVRSVKSAYGDPLVSRERLVVLRVRADVRHQVAEFTTVTLHTADGDDYDPRDEFSSAGLLPTQPGFTRTATLVFEVPTDSVADARLVVGPDQSEFDVYSSALRIDLGLNAGTPVQGGTVVVKDSTISVTP